MKKNCFKKIVTIIVLTAIVFTMAVPTFAAGRPYFDITKSTVGTHCYKSIKYIKKHHGYDGVIKGKIFSSQVDVKGKEAIKVFRNLFGKKNVPITAKDRKKLKKRITNKWIFKKLAAIAKKRGVVYEKDARITVYAKRMDLAVYIMEFCCSSKKLRPLK